MIATDAHYTATHTYYTTDESTNRPYRAIVVN